MVSVKGLISLTGFDDYGNKDGIELGKLYCKFQSLRKEISLRKDGPI